MRSISAQTTLVPLLVLIAFATPARADAQVLPVVVDATGTTEVAWWVGGDEPRAEFVAALVGAAGSALLDPTTARPTTEVSRVLRRADITDSNARSLAGLYGASEVLCGRVERSTAGSIAWIGVDRFTVHAALRLVDVASGAVLWELDDERVGFGNDGAHRAAVAMAHAVAARLSRAGAGGPVGVDSDVPVVVVESPSGAQPYIAFRGALADEVVGIVEVTEVWASEGRVAFALLLDEGVARDDVSTALQRFRQSPPSGFRVVGWHDDADVLRVRLAPVFAPDGSSW
ncbi:MAG: hypothetical protein H6698_01395 [Myxococcales bacterium]|nr:hypothetical protein [Myxococcales bacterium]MCB9531054.1 hypothetical protein [Myxococcales bacterium]MCB9532964.1 hypothetical protein [Myxococcales bacterium]